MKKYQISCDCNSNTPNIIFTNSEETSSYPELNEIDNEILCCEEVSRKIMLEYSDIDRSIDEFRSQYRNASDKLMNIGETLSLGIDEKNLDKNKTLVATTAAIEGAGLLLHLGGAVIAGIKEYKAYKQMKGAKEILLIKKQEIAREKLDDTIALRDTIRNENAAKAKLLFDKEGNKTIILEHRDIQLKIFKKVFSILRRYDNVIWSIEDVIAEMNAWLDGQHDAKYRDHSPSLLSDFVFWEDSYSAKYLEETTELPTKVAFVLSEPALIKSYVGLECPLLPCESPDITFNEEGYQVNNTYAQNIISKNPYVQECNDTLKLYGKFYPQLQIKLSISDYIVLLASILIPIGLILLLFLIIKGTFLRVVVSAILIWWGIDCNYLISDFSYDLYDLLKDMSFPISKKVKNEKERYAKYLYSIYKQHEETYNKYNKVEL